MSRPQFGVLSKAWSDDPVAAKLINDHVSTVSSMAYYMEKKCIGEDFEAAYMEALYDLAFNWKPGEYSFKKCLWSKCRSKNKNIRYRFERWAKSMKRYPSDAIDDRMSYRDTQVV